MLNSIADHFDTQTTADQFAAAKVELRNAKALSDKLQTLLDSKAHEVEALHKEVDNLAATLKAANNSARHWQDRAEVAEHDRSEMAGALIMHADGDFLVGNPPPLQLAKHIVDKLVTASEPDIETVPLQDLLEAVGTFLEQGQSITIRGSHEPVSQVEIHALGLSFDVWTHEADELLTHAAKLAQHLIES